MSGDGRPLSVRLHEKAGHLEAFAPATAQDFHEIADELAALEPEPSCAPGVKMPVPVDEHCIAAFNAWISPGVCEILKRDGWIGGGFLVRTYSSGSRVRIIILEEAAPL